MCRGDELRGLAAICFRCREFAVAAELQYLLLLLGHRPECVEELAVVVAGVAADHARLRVLEVEDTHPRRARSSRSRFSSSGHG